MALVSSDGEVATHVGVVQIVRLARMDDPAAIHDVDVIGKLAAEIEILLDEEDGDATESRR